MKSRSVKLLLILAFLIQLLVSPLYLKPDMAVGESAQPSDGSGAIVEKPARILPPPSVIKGDDGSFRFAVFGDSRTGDVLESSIADAEFGSKQFTDMDIIEENEKEFAIYRNQLFDRIASGFKTDSKKSGDDKFGFALFGGDFVRMGTRGYWNELKNSFLDKIVGNDVNSRRIFPSIGNHEEWAGPELEKRLGIASATKGALDLYFDAFPWLVSDTGWGHEEGLHNYAFYIDNNVFVTLCAGNMVFDSSFPDNADGIFLCEQCTFGEQMDWLKQVLDYGIQTQHIKNVFVQYHKPSYSSSKHPPLKQCSDPLNVMSVYKSKYPSMNMFVFNGHNHTTELYRTKDGITVLVAGGGGAPQKASDTNRDWSSYKETQKELFWDSLKPHVNGWQKRVNYFVVTVKSDKIDVQEMCLTNIDGTYRFEKGIKIDQDGKITAPDHNTGFLN